MKLRPSCRAMLTLAATLFGLAASGFPQASALSVHLSGLINDYTPVTGVSGPWEMRGEWSLEVKGDSGHANFTADLNMTHSDYWVVLNPGAADDNSASTGRHPHTHHITITDASITALDGGGFQVSGPVFVTNDGNSAPFMAKCSLATPCMLTVNLIGGQVLALSNITLTFAGPPTSHFGTQSIHGFVRTATWDRF